MAVLCSLENATSVKQTEGQIRLILQSPSLTSPIVLVEGYDDYIFYRSMLCVDSIILIPVKENGTGNYHNVINVTESLHDSFSRCNVIGIRDRDYTKYEMPAPVISDWVLFSEGHSLECMLLMADSVKDVFLTSLPAINGRFQNVIDNCRHIANYYILNAYKNLRISFNRNNIHLINYFDSHIRDMNPSWKEDMKHDFERVYPEFDSNEMQQIVENLGVNNEQDMYVCRGHDIVDVCYEMGKANGLEKKNLINTMISAYSKEDFETTEIFNDLQQIERERNISLIR